MDDDKLKEIMAIGAEAETLLNHPVYKRVTMELRAEFFEATGKTGLKDVETREEIYRMNKALTMLMARIERKVRDGETAKKTLLQRIKEKVRRVK